MVFKNVLSLRPIILEGSGLIQRKLNVNTLFKQNAHFKNQQRIQNLEGFTPKRKLVRVPEKIERLTIDTGNIESSSLWKSFIFTAVFGTGTFIGVSIWEYETIRTKAIHALRHGYALPWLKSKIQGGKQEVNELKREFDIWWSRLSPGERIFAPICAINLAVYGLWRVRAIHPFMLTYFASNPAAKVVCWPMLLSTFSHYSLFHIFANMYVLHSFSHSAVAILGREQFLGMYLTAGVVASYASYLFKAVVKQPGLSLGASGAIMAVLGYVCSEYPDTQLSILFLPMWTFSAGVALKVILGMDLVGVLMGWKVFDHAAHLGGALFGIFWSYYGSTQIWPKREYVVQIWNQIRGPPTAK